MPKIEKAAIPIFLDEQGKPIAAIIFVKGQRIIFTLDVADEDQIIKLFEKETTTIKS